MNKRPRLKIARTSADWLMEIAGVVLLLLLMGMPVFYYSELPELVPRHYNALGEPDAYSDKATLWVLPLVGTVLFVGLLILSRFPHVFNYLEEITEQNAPRQYRMAARMVRILNLVVVAAFAFIQYRTIHIGLGEENALGVWFLPVLLSAITLPIVYLIYQSTRNSKA